MEQASEKSKTFDTYYNSMSESYGILQSLVNPPRYRVLQQYKISQFNTRGRVRGGCIRDRGHIDRVYVYGCGNCRSVRGGHGGRSYGKNPYAFAIRYIKFVPEAYVYPAEKWRLLSFQQKNNVQ